MQLVQYLTVWYLLEKVQLPVKQSRATLVPGLKIPALILLCSPRVIVLKPALASSPLFMNWFVLGIVAIADLAGFMQLYVAISCCVNGLMIMTPTVMRAPHDEIR